MTTDQAAPHGRDSQGRALTPYGRKADGTIRLKPGRGKRTGAVEKTKTGWRARYTAPDGSRASKSFPGQTKMIAEAWLSAELTKIARGEWKSREQIAAERVAEEQRRLADEYTLGEWAQEWLRGLERAGRTAKTVQTHRYRLSAHVLPAFGDRALRVITEAEITAWFDAKHAKHGRGVSRGLAMTMRAMLNQAVAAKRIESSPVVLPGATKHKAVKSKNVQVASPHQVAMLADSMPKYLRIATHLAAWCQLREGELLELRRRDIDLKGRTVSISRQVQFISGQGPIVTPPKSEAGRRVNSIPKAIADELGRHMLAYSGPGIDGLIVPHPRDRGNHLHHNTFRAAHNRARSKVDGLDEFVFHDLRHTGLTQLARQGATFAELLARAGHNDLSVAMIYQHAEAERDRALADRLGEIVVTSAAAEVIELEHGA